MRAMHSLSCSKYKVLLKEPAGKTISKSDKFKLNLDFTDKSRRIKVKLLSTLACSYEVYLDLGTAAFCFDIVALHFRSLEEFGSLRALSRLKTDVTERICLQ